MTTDTIDTLEHAQDRTEPSSQDCELSIVMPCLNEAETLAICIDKAVDYLKRSGVSGEVIIADNGSDDGSQEIAVRHGARVVDIPGRGYGAALGGGIKAARGRYVIMGDSDDSYDFSQLENFIAKLRDGHDLVMGNRFAGGIAPGAMPPLHKYLGNPVLSTIGRLFFWSRIRDFHCGLRGFNRGSILGLDLQSTGMEFASEMVVKATLAELRLAEVPTTLSPDGRTRPPHLRSWHDGWRHLKLLLMYAPRWLFLFPSLFLVLSGLFVMGAVLPGPVSIGSVVFDVHTMLVAMAALLVGSQALVFFLIAKQFAINERLLPEGPNFRKFREMVSLERAVSVGATMFGLGALGVVAAFIVWASSAFGNLDYGTIMRVMIPSVSLLAIGIQFVFAGFLSGILDLKHSKT